VDKLTILRYQFQPKENHRRFTLAASPEELKLKEKRTQAKLSRRRAQRKRNSTRNGVGRKAGKTNKTSSLTIPTKLVHFGIIKEKKKTLKFTSINISSDSLIMAFFRFTTTRIFIGSALFAISALLIPIFYKPLHPAFNDISSYLNYSTATDTETFNATMTGKKTVAYFVNWVRDIQLQLSFLLF